MNENMCCRGMQYDVGKTYHVDGEIELCQNGLHFCKNLVDVFNFYPKFDGNRFFEVETRGQVCEDGVKCATDTLTVLRELTDAEINRVFYGNGDGDGNNFCYGYGDDYGGDGYGDDYGDGEGFGDGCGYGDGGLNGYGDGRGNGGGGNGKNIQRVLIFK